jgi:YNFM family putative membrane transporter
MLPALATSFSTNTTEAAAAISAYAIAYGVMQTVYGPLGDRFGKPRVILFATVWCCFSSVLAAAAPSMETLVFARAAMGAGTAAIVPLSIAWIGDTVPLVQRQHALARYSGVTVFGMTLGPLIGGLLAEAFSWRAAFALLAVLFAAMAVLLFSKGCSASEVAESNAAPVVRTPYLEQVAVLLRDRWARVVLLAGALEGAFGIGGLAFVPTVLHTRSGLTLLEGGAVAAAFGLGGFFFTRAAPWLLRRFASDALPHIGGVMLAGAFLILAVLPHWSLAVCGCLLAGFGFFAMHNTLQVQATQLSAGSTGLAVSVFSCSLFIGQSIGVTVGALVIARSTPEWLFGTAAVGLLLLGKALQRALLARAPTGFEVAGH